MMRPWLEWTVMDSSEPSPSPTCRRGPRWHISRAPKKRRSAQAPADLACPPGDGDHNVLPPCIFRTIEGH